MKHINFFGATVLAVLMMLIGCKNDDVTISGITISSTAETIEEGASTTLYYTVEPEDAEVKSAVWSSSSETVASVDQNGLVTGLAEGTATITVTVNGRFTATCIVTVESAKLYGEVAALGKYIGMSLADAKTGFADEGWTVIQDDAQAYIVGKNVDGSDVTAELTGDTSLDLLETTISDVNAIANGTTMFSQVGETYEFVTLDATADFSYFWGEVKDSKTDKSTYTESKEWLNNNSEQCIAFLGAWITMVQSEPLGMMVKATKSSNKIEISFVYGGV